MHWYNEKRPWKHMLHALGMTVVFVLAVTIFSNSRAVGTYLASDLLGQFVPTAVVTPIFTSEGGGGSDVGFSDVLSSVAVDTVNHRLFASDSTGNRVLVFNLSAGNNVNDYIADFVLGQTTFAGSSSGTTATTLSAPRSLAFDSTNNRLFVSDTGNNRVLVYDTASIVNGESAVNVLGATDFVTENNSPGQGFIGVPDGLALDANGYLYVAGTANSSSNTGTRVLVFDVRPSGAGSQALCGESTSGIVNGMDASCVIGQADFDSFATGSADTYFANGGMYGLSIDTVNNRLFVNDAGRHRVLVFNLATITNGDLSVNIPMNVLGQSTLLGTSSALGASRFNTPEGSWYDSATGMLFVAESGNNRVVVFDARPSGSGSQSLCGVSGTGIADGMDASCVIGQPHLNDNTSGTTANTFHAPRGVHVASSYVFVTDSNNRRLVLFDFSTPVNNPTASSVVGVISEVVSIGTTPQWTSNAINSNVVYNSVAYTGKKSAVGFEGPSEVILDKTHNRLFVADVVNNRILIFNLDVNNILLDGIADGVIGQSNFIDGNINVLSEPGYMAYDEVGDRLFVPNTDQSSIYVFDVASAIGGNLTPAYTIGDGSTLISATSAAYSSDLVYDPDTQILYSAQSVDTQRVVLYDVRPNGSPAITMCGVSSTGIADAMNASCVIGQTDFTSGDTGVTETNFYGVGSLALDTANDRLFVSDSIGRVLVFDTSSFVDGNGTNGIAADNVLGAADFVNPGSGLVEAGTFGVNSHLAYDSTLGKLFVSDATNNRVLVFDGALGSITDGEDAEAVIGQSDFTSSTGATTQGDLNGNSGITFDPTARRLYVADSANNRVLMFDTIIFDPSITTTLPVTGGTPFSTTLPTLQDQGTASYTLVSGALPTGLSLTGSGISGTPSADGVYNFTLQAVDTYTGGVMYSPTLAFTYTVTGTPAGTTGTTGSSSSSSSTGVVIPPSTTTTGTTGTGTTTTGTTTTGTSTTGSSSTSGTSGSASSGSGATGTGTAPGTTTSGGTGTIPTNPTTGGTTGGVSTGTSTGSNPPPTSGGCPGNILNTIVCIVEDSVDYTEGVLVDTTGQIRGIITEPAGDIISKLIGIVGILAGALFTLLPVLFANPLSFSELLLIPARLWSLLLIAFGLKKRNRPWGRVYDSVTKQPLDPVYVSLQNNEGKEVASSITDIDGRYGFLVEPGMYRMIPKKTHYSFPSAKLIGKTRDELYLDLYFGYIFEVKEAGEVITKNIPMDPDTFDWNEFAKQEQTLMRFYSKRDRVFARIADVAFSVGLTVSTIALIVAPITYNIVIFSLYIVMLVIKEVGFRQRSSGIVVRKGTDLPVPFAIMRVLSSKTKVEVLHKVTNTLGRYYALVGNGTYDVTIETKNLDGSYSLAMKKENIEIKDGLLKQKFEV